MREEALHAISYRQLLKRAQAEGYERYEGESSLDYIRRYASSMWDPMPDKVKAHVINSYGDTGSDFGNFMEFTRMVMQGELFFDGDRVIGQDGVVFTEDTAPFPEKVRQFLREFKAFIQQLVPTLRNSGVSKEIIDQFLKLKEGISIDYKKIKTRLTKPVLKRIGRSMKDERDSNSEVLKMVEARTQEQWEAIALMEAKPPAMKHLKEPEHPLEILRNLEKAATLIRMGSLLALKQKPALN